jgi:hypothetical protein
MAIAEVSRVTSDALRTQGTSDAPVKAASVALVPMAAAPRRLAPLAAGLARPDPSFVTHLIAMAELSPQTRLLRRAACGEVEAAYGSVANQSRTVTLPGARMRQIA